MQDYMSEELALRNSRARLIAAPVQAKYNQQMQKAELCSPHACVGDEGHVDVRPKLRQDSLLAMPGGEFVTDDRVPIQAHEDVCSLQVWITCPDYGHLIHYTNLLSLEIACLGFACAIHKQRHPQQHGPLP